MNEVGLAPAYSAALVLPPASTRFAMVAPDLVHGVAHLHEHFLCRGLGALHCPCARANDRGAQSLDIHQAKQHARHKHMIWHILDNRKSKPHCHAMFTNYQSCFVFGSKPSAAGAKALARRERPSRAGTAAWIEMILRHGRQRDVCDCASHCCLLLLGWAKASSSST